MRKTRFICFETAWNCSRHGCRKAAARRRGASRVIIFSPVASCGPYFHKSFLALAITRFPYHRRPMPAPIRTLETPLRELDWLAPPRVRQLERFGLETVGQLLTHFPRRARGSIPLRSIPFRRLRGSRLRLRAGEKDAAPPHSRTTENVRCGVGRGGAHAFSTPLVCRWFNAHWVEKAIARRAAAGRLWQAEAQRIEHGHRSPGIRGRGGGRRSGVGPLESNRADASRHRRAIAAGVATDHLGRAGQLEENAIETLVPRNSIDMPRAWALRQIHFPETLETLAKARRHLVLDGIFRHATLHRRATRRTQSAQPGADHAASGRIWRRLHAALPFPLTGAQLRAIEEIRADLARAAPDEPAAARRRRLRQNAGGLERDAAVGGSRLAGRAHGAHADPRRAALPQPRATVRTARPARLPCAPARGERRAGAAARCLPGPACATRLRIPGSTAVPAVGAGVPPGLEPRAIT